MDEAWERAVDAARNGEDPPSVRALTLDGALKCSQGRLPSSSLLEQFSQLRALSIANVGLSSLAEFPSLPLLERLILSDNRIASGLEFLVEAGLLSLRDLDLSNNRIQLLEDLAPLAKLNLLSLDLYECPVTRLPDYRSKVFSLIKSLQYLDKLDAEDNERPESDDEEEDEEDDVEDELADGLDADGDEEDYGKLGGGVVSSTGIEDEDDEKDEDGDESDELDEEDDVRPRYPAATNNLAHSNDDSGSEEEEVDDDNDAENVEVQDVEESEEEEAGEDEEDGVEGEDDDEDDEDEEEEGTEHVSGRFGIGEGEIDAQDDGEDDNGELGDEEEDADEGVENDDAEDEDDEEEDYGTEYLVQQIAQAEDEEGASDFEPGEDEEEEDDDIDDEEQDDEEPALAALKRKRSKDQGEEDDEKDGRPPKR